MPPSACFDVLGTCFDFGAPIGAIHARLGPHLARANSDPTTFFFAWFYAAQRDFTYVSLAAGYTPLSTVLRQTLRRASRAVGVPAEAVGDDDVAAVMAAFEHMAPRDGLAACFDGLARAGWDVYGVTNGGVDASLACFRGAGVALDEAHLLSCDELRVAKPDARVYARAHERLTEHGVGEAGDGTRWFVAAHAWDLMAARKAGFKTAYLDFEEHDPVTDVFGHFDLYASSMAELLQKLQEAGERESA